MLHGFWLKFMPYHLLVRMLMHTCDNCLLYLPIVPLASVGKYYGSNNEFFAS